MQGKWIQKHQHNKIHNQKSQAVMAEIGKYKLTELEHDYGAFEPFIDEATMRIHHGKHHKTYTDNFNLAINGTELENLDIIDLFGEISKHPQVLRNQGGGYWNHHFMWKSITPNSSRRPPASLLAAIEKEIGSLQKFQEDFNKAGASVFGSGWVWLIVNQQKKLQITTTPNQDNPYMDVVGQRGTPILVFDVWEHAYYLKFQNRRLEYLANYWNVVDWKVVENRYKNAIK